MALRLEQETSIVWDEDEQREAAKERFARIRSERQDNKGENEDENLDDD